MKNTSHINGTHLNLQIIFNTPPRRTDSDLEIIDGSYLDRVATTAPSFNSFGLAYRCASILQ